MGHYKIQPKDVFFILKEQLGYGSLSRLESYRWLDEKTLDLLVTEAIRFSKGVVDPLNAIGESEGPRLETGRVSSQPAFRKAFREFGKQGWIAVARDPEYGGQGFPNMMRIVVNEFMYGACQAFNMAASLTHGAAHLIEEFGTRNLKHAFVPKMYSGQWSGTMCLTESDAGSNLAAIQTRATPAGDHYNIRGSKIFISWGDHDLTENIIHLVLARLKGAPPGTRGLSLFVVPKQRIRNDGSLGDRNDVVCTRLEEKLGLHGSPTAALEFGSRDACVGYLCGERNQGLTHMFQMMNAARINAGVSGMAMAGAAYRHAVDYARQRVQGKDVTGRGADDVVIIRHPDVRRMLMEMKAMVDGMRSLIYSAAFWSELALEMPVRSERDHYADLTDFLTPIIKAYCSANGFRVCETAIQCLGGHGYCKDYPLEQYLRDAKILSLYEGTNGIQSIDLMGRKITLREGACLNAFRIELEGFCRSHRNPPGLRTQIRALAETAEDLWKMTGKLRTRRETDPAQWAAVTCPALMAFGDVAVAWRLLDMARVAWPFLNRGDGGDAFYRGKVLQAIYFAETRLPLTRAAIQTLLREGREIVEMPDDAF
ncbi:Acyl-CoA dehydrogenase [Olavius algarvensis associated proteobacterium Delta 3]|nr:Acyl-CoA dehydrogenase [Olavius algarvensis associated proteobacterium Delta 3]